VTWYTGDETYDTTVVLTGATVHGDTAGVFSVVSIAPGLPATLEVASDLAKKDNHVIAVYKTIMNHPRPVIASVNGDAVGAGAGLVSFSDMAISTGKAAEPTPIAATSGAPAMSI